MNPLNNIEFWIKEKGMLPFHEIKAEHFIPALKIEIELAQKLIEQYKKGAGSSFDECITPLEELMEKIDLVASLFGTYNGSCCTKEIQDISSDFYKELTDFSSSFSLDEGVFKRVKNCYESKDQQDLTIEQEAIVEKYYKSFARNGALLSDQDKEKIKKIDSELSELGTKFAQNSLNSNNAFELLVTDLDKLEGLPQDALARAKAEAEARKKEGWVFTLQYPSYIPFMSYCKNRELREKFFIAMRSVALSGEFDNREIVKKQIQLKEQRAKILGFKNHAAYVLDERMAKNPVTVLSFIKDIGESAKETAEFESKKLAKLQEELFPGTSLAHWDTSYLAEILKKKELDFDTEELRPYFQLENVVKGVFTVAKKLFGLKFEEDKTVQTHHPDVQVFRVSEENGDFTGLFYMDLFTRATKKQGAWMSDMIAQGLLFGEVRRPHIGIVCNFSKPTEENPTLLNMGEVRTLFHEFGHALHGLLAKGDYRYLAGVNVSWDFVELPSQLMENWLLEKECLDLFAVHYKSGETIPLDLIEKVKKSQQFLEGRQTMRQMSFAELDMRYHTTESTQIQDIVEFENSIFKNYSSIPLVPGTCMSTSFGHIFAGGYSAGYYSYKWAEVLEADAFEVFQKQGIFNRDLANKYRHHILEKGGTEDPMELYIRFKGGKPSNQALLKRSGFLK